MQPILYNVPAFDAGQDHEFSFSFSGNQPFKNQLVIRNNETDTIVYDQTITTMQLKHTVPASSLINKTTQYNAQIQTFDSENTPSGFSEKIIFYCLDTPIWAFFNLTDGQQVQNSIFSPVLTYSQAQGELLNSYEITLYDSLQDKVTSTGVTYDTSGDLTGIFNVLQDNQMYYIKATGETVNHMLLDTGYVSINVEYVQPVLFDVVDIESLPRQGTIRIASNIQSVVGHSEQDPLTYIDNTKVDLSATGASVIYDDAFLIESDFTMQINGSGFKDNSAFLEMTNGCGKIELLYKKALVRSEVNEKVFAVLNSASSGITYTTISNLIDVPQTTDNINIWLRRKNSLFEIVLENTTA